VVADIRAGEALTAAHVRAIRPGLGLPPRYLDEVLGRSAAVDIARGTPLSWELLR
jgi:sialic acid synthase SpsE